MANVRVYNPANTPTIIDDGRTLGGFEWHDVAETPLVSNLMKARKLVTKRAPGEAGLANGHKPVTDVSSNQAEKKEEPEAVLDMVLDETPVEAPSVSPSPATISKGRRSRKPSPNKE